MAEIGSIGSTPVPLSLPGQDDIALVPLGSRGYTPNPYRVGGTGDATSTPTTNESGLRTSDQNTNGSQSPYSWSETKLEGVNSNNATQKTGTSNGGTNVFNDLNGRDPDLVHGGEVFKLADGTTYTATDADTLESISRKTGNSVAQLMQQNGMNAALYGKNDSGQYFKVGKMTTSSALSPSPGTTTVNAVAATTRTDTEQAVNTNTRENKEALAALLKFADSLEDGQSSKALVQKAIDKPDSITESESAKLTELQNLKTEYDSTLRPVERKTIA
jgi:LysM repeat protein